MVGITNVTNVTMENITRIANVTNPTEIFININNIVYGGMLYFSLLWVLWIILFMAGQSKDNQPLSNAMYSGAIVSIIAMIIRAITMTYKGIVYGLVSDLHMWMFPLITVILVVVAWTTRE